MGQIVSPFIQELSDTQYITRTVPTTILVSKMDQYFTILEANEEYYRLIGYSKEEVWEKFRNRGYDTLHPDDRQAAVESLAFQADGNDDKVFSVKCRLIHKEDGYHVAHFRGRIGTLAGESVFYFLITDITEHMHVMQQLEEEQEFNNRIASFTENAFFDYDIQGDTMRFSSQLAVNLGIPNIIKNFKTAMVELGLVTQETAKQISSHFVTQGDVETVDEEFAITSLTGVKTWYQCSYRALCNEEGVAHRVVGRLTDITKQHTRINELSIRASQDPLTGLLNKGITERMIQDYLKMTTQDGQHAFLIVDLDNFKKINDTFGHQYGDTVLQDVAKTLKSMFRQDDVIGRVGGDEFVVFMKNCKATEIVYFKAKELNKALQRVCHQEDVTIQLSASIGIALYRQDGFTFQSLYACADKALYTVKKAGRNSVSFYS